MRRFFAQLHRDEPLLSAAAWISLVLGLTALAATWLDPRTILGIDPWIKPAKFLLSFVIYFWTLAWLLPLVDAPRSVRFVRYAVFFTMLGEIICIVFQASRGRMSHFNILTPLDAAIFGTMGTLILINSLAIGVLIYAFREHGLVDDRALRLAIILGLSIFLAGSFQASFMLSRDAHTVGAPDGGPGLPLVNWSTRHGDLRVAHFIGLHAMQGLPLIALLLARKTSWPESRRKSVVIAAALVWTFVMVALTAQALAGRALLEI